MKKRNTSLMGKKLLAGFLVFCCVLFGLTGCKIETPEEAAENAASLSQSVESTEESELSAEESTQEASASSSGTDTSQESESSSSETSSQTSNGNTQTNEKTTGSQKSSSGSSSGNSGSASSSSGSTSKPAPVEPEDTQPDENKPLTCTLSITCKTILDNMDLFNKEKLGVLPKDGVIYAKRTVTFYEGETVFDVLLRETKKNRIHMEHENFPLYNSEYIEGINNIYEFDCGEGSGWMFKVNGWFPNYGCSRYEVKQGDQIEWIYTCDLGHDIGGELDRYE